MALTEKDRLVKEIAKDLYLREDVVREVLDRFQDVAIAKIVNNGEFKYSRFFSITSKDFKSYETTHGIVPPHKRLSIKLSEGVRKLFKMKNENIVVNKDNWKELLSTSEAKQPRKVNEQHQDWNPLLDEDE